MLVHCLPCLSPYLSYCFFFLMIPPPPRSTLFPYTTLFRSQFAFAVLLIAFGLSTHLVISAIAAFFAGACVVGVVSLYSSLVQLEISDSMRGRVMSIFMLAFRGGMPLGALLAGAVIERSSLAVALTINGAPLAVIAAAFLISGRNLDEA